MIDSEVICVTPEALEIRTMSGKTKVFKKSRLR